MATISDFVKIPKIDSCKHLSTGMRYSSFVQWAGFLVPGFSEDKIQYPGTQENLETRAEIEKYTYDRISSARDILLLFCRSISESESENVKDLYGTINVDFVSKCGDTNEFLEVVKKSAEKFSTKIKFHPFLGINSEKENNLTLGASLLDSGFFEGIELYGTNYAENPEKYLSIFSTARKMNLKSRICCLGFRPLKNRVEIFELLENFNPTHILNPNIALNNDGLNIFENGKLSKNLIDFVKNTNLKIEFSPAPLLSGKKVREKTEFIRECAEKGLEISLCTEDSLFLNKSISEFSLDLCNAEIFSKEELESLISVKS